jgi:hypothetical protein
MHKLTKHLMSAEEASAPIPCGTDPERWFPNDQKPDPGAVAACWSCYFQQGCARRALSEPRPDHGIWGGYRLAPGPGLKRSRQQLAIIAGETVGPPASPGPEVLEELAADSGGDVIDLASRTTARSALPQSQTAGRERYRPPFRTPSAHAG